jgi:D-beta-D-heptose 7-phosphate kinase/D-beta-D-heptose 1-phosphate adenosyltransferase
MKKLKKISKNYKTTKNKKQKKIVMVSGGFDPIHIGHVRYMREAKKLGDELVVVINNDNWFRVKGKTVFMPDLERKEIIEALSFVDKVVISFHPENTKDISVSNEIRKIKPHIFANGGDRSPKQVDIPSSEYNVCKELGIKMVFNVGRGGKIRSSSELLKKYSKNIKKK